MSLLAPQFTSFCTGFTPAETSSLLVLETSVSRSLGASFSELIGHPTPPDQHVPGPSTVAPIIETTEMLSSLVASSEQATTVIPAQSTAATTGHASAADPHAAAAS